MATKGWPWRLALRDGDALPLGKSPKMSPNGTYRQKDVLENVGTAHRDGSNLNVKAKIFADSTQLCEAQGLICFDVKLVFPYPNFTTALVKSTIGHRYNAKDRYLNVEDACFMSSQFGHRALNDS